MVTAETALAAVVALLAIGHKPYFWDEAWSVVAASRSLHGLVAIFPHRDADTALYYFLLHGWIALHGTGEGYVRLLSALFAVATVPVTAVLALKLFDRRVALWAGVLMAANAAFLEYAQFARTYALAMFLGACSTLLFVIALERKSLRYGLA